MPPPLKTLLQLNETQFGLLAAAPALSGALVRVPLGIWTDRYGGRIVLFLLAGLFVGLAGGSFSVPP